MTTTELSRYIAALADYALEKQLIAPEDEAWAVNSLLAAMGAREFVPPAEPLRAPLHQLLEALTGYAVEQGLCGEDITSRDLFDTSLMGLLTARPSQVIREFRERYAASPEAATGWYYAFSQDTNYIRRDRIAKDRKWVAPTGYGELDITINLSKPEKDPRAIAAAKKAPQSGYPKCQLCRENEGYPGQIGRASCRERV